MFVFVRYSFTVCIAAAVTFGLFFIMQLLIATGNDVVTDTEEYGVIDFVSIREKPNVVKKRLEVKKPEKPEEIPESPKLQFEQIASVSSDIYIAPIKAEADVDTNINFFGTDGHYLPIIKVAPVYPRRALQKGIEGYVVLEFTVTKNGSVKDPIVVAAEPNSVFNNAAIKAALKFKYKPTVQNGKAVEVPGVQNKITFQLEK